MGGESIEETQMDVEDAEELVFKLPESLQQEQEAFNSFKKDDLKKGDFWYLINAKWWTLWKNYIEKGGERPGQIDNSKLMKNDYELLMQLGEGNDYEIISKDAYNYLKFVYGSKIDICREVLTKGQLEEEYVELYPKFFTVAKCGDDGEPVEDSKKVVFRARNSTFKELANDYFTDLESDIVATNVRIWIKLQKQQDEKEDNNDEKMQDEDEKKDSDSWLNLTPRADNSLDQFKLTPESIIMFEQKTEDGWTRTFLDWRAALETGSNCDAQDTVHKWYPSEIVGVNKAEDTVKVHFIGWKERWDEWLPRSSPRITEYKTKSEEKAVSRYSMSSSLYSYGSNREGSPTVAGAVGLVNLGNTCFMNSTLQCLSHTEPLTDYFKSDKYVADINVDNPLGHKGQIAEAYGELIKSIWGGKYTCVAPRDLKYKIGTFAPRFSGYQQQDSQELLSFLLDGLHEDVNKVLKKPSTKAVESKNRPDAEVAEEAWNVYKKRNKSVIVDIFTGQLKSHVVCPTCKRVSNTFDPFTSLAVPLPGLSTKTQAIIFVGLGEDRQPKRLSVSVPKHATIKQLCKALQELTKVPASKLVVCDVWNSKVYRAFKNTDDVSEFGSNDKIYAFEVAESTWNGENEVVAIQHFVAGKWDDFDSISGSMPGIVMIPSEGSIKAKALKEKVLEIVGPYTKGTPVKWILKKDYAKDEDLEDDNIDVEHSKRLKLILCWQSKEQFLEDKCEPTSKKGKDKSGGNITLEDCLDEFTKEEVLSEQDAWYCSKCKAFKCASKKFTIWKLPEILVIPLKRFSYTKRWREKISSQVDCPIKDLRLAKYCVNEDEKDSSYDLYAISNHMGGMGGGHYNARCKNPLDGKWYCLDDSSVREISDQNLVNGSAYVLYYRKRH